MLAKLNRLTNWQAALILVVIGLAVFFTGLANPFQGDDNAQIVDNPVIHSITHIGLLFEGSTFYNGGGIAPLGGIYYRPLMSTTFMILYALFGLHTFAYHLLQLLLCIGSAILLFLVFTYSFNRVMALILALVFLVHPLNSQVVFSIPAMQDALFFFFGILSIWLLLRFKTIRSLTLVAVSLFLSLLSKEAGFLFVIMAILYLIWFDRKRLLPFLAIMAAPIALYLVLKVHAVGLAGHTNIASIDDLSLSGRIMTMPSIMLFYMTKFVFPWKLASGYYWTYATFSFRHVFFPLVIDLGVIALSVHLGIVVHRRLPRAQFLTYLFFGVWLGTGLLAYSQLFPLDLTACETWFYFPIVGLLGMIGVVLMTFRVRIKPRWLIVVVASLIFTLGLRTAFRGHDWSSAYTLYSHDISASNEDYIAYYELSSISITRGGYLKAKEYATRSIAIYPNYDNYNTLGLALVNLGEYEKAHAAYEHGLQYGSYSLLYENEGKLALLYGDYTTNEQFLQHALTLFPHDGTVWLELAILDAEHGDSIGAKSAMANAALYMQVPQVLYDSVMNNQPTTVRLTGVKQAIHIP